MRTLPIAACHQNLDAPVAAAATRQRCETFAVPEPTGEKLHGDASADIRFGLRG